MKPYIDNLSKCADCYVFAYPNAGLPNAMGGYDQKVTLQAWPPTDQPAIACIDSHRNSAARAVSG